MSLILHLSDLHLSSLPDDTVDDWKSDVVPRGVRTDRIAQLKRTLSALAQSLHGAGRELAAVVISGDVTYQNRDDGYAVLDEVLGSLGPMCPPRAKIAIVPGNHDVERGTPPSSVERYEKFRRLSAAGYVTPLIHGIHDPSSLSVSELAPHYLEGDEWCLLPINSANYCVSTEPLRAISEAEWEQIPEQLRPGDAAAVAEVRRDLARLRAFDIAYIDEPYLDELRDVLNRVLMSAPSSPSKIRIGVLHHQLLPVSVRTEFKAFESIVNLGLLRNFLRVNRFDLILHGHKHAGFVYWDHIQGFGVGEPSRRILVVSAAAPDTTRGTRDICRLIEIGGHPEAPVVRIHGVSAVTEGTSLPPSPAVNYHLWWEGERLDTTGSVPIRLYGQSVEELHSKIFQVFEAAGPDMELRNVVCTLTDSSNADQLPATYPPLPDVLDAGQWFSDIVDWWQSPDVSFPKASAMSFNHGTRIIGSGASGWNQIDRVVKTLLAEPDTTRAVVTLLSPEDRGGEFESGRMPSFCLIQFLVRGSSGGALDCIAFFRKQEMRYWWPVNVAEVVRLQCLVIGRLKADSRFRDLKPGAVVTIAAAAKLGKSAPRVAIPLVDRLFDERPEELTALAYAIVAGAPPTADIESQWAQVIKDLSPEPTFDKDGVPVPLEGIEFLCKTARRLLGITPHRSNEVEQLINELERIHRANQLFAEAVRSTRRVESDTHRRWREQIEPLVESVKQQLARLWSRLGKSES